MNPADLIEREQAFWQASGDGAFYREHFAEDGLCVFPMGTLDKDTTVAAIEQAAPWVEAEFTDERVVMLSADAAALVYRARARRATDTAPYEAHVTSVYTRRDGHWLLTVHQQTPVQT